MFDQAGIDAAAADGVTLDLSTFDQYRLPDRPSERVPDLRVGHAASGRVLYYLQGLPGSVRVDGQVYADSWGVLGGMVEPGLNWTMSQDLLLTIYGRFYGQSGASFWRRTYVVADAGQVPRWRTLDRELSPYIMLTGGARLEWSVGSLSGYAEASGMETLYSDYLFLSSRFALVGQVGLRLAL
jgi:hypothetical protein